MRDPDVSAQGMVILLHTCSMIWRSTFTNKVEISFHVISSKLISTVVPTKSDSDVIFCYTC